MLVGLVLLYVFIIIIRIFFLPNCTAKELRLKLGQVKVILTQPGLFKKNK